MEKEIQGLIRALDTTLDAVDAHSKAITQLIKASDSQLRTIKLLEQRIQKLEKNTK